MIDKNRIGAGSLRKQLSEHFNKQYLHNTNLNSQRNK